MSQNLLLLPFTLLVMGNMAIAQSTTRPAIVTDQPQQKMGHDGKPDESFLRQHEAIMASKTTGPIDLLFLGDSITANWRHASQVWKAHFGQYNPANFGIGGDATQHILWRIQQGELDGLHPKVLVLLAGGNNHLQTAPQILNGINAILAQVHMKLPDTRVLILGILPRGADPADKHDKKTGDVAAVRANNHKVNAELAKLDDGDRIRYLNLDDIFLDPKGFIPPEKMADALHPTPEAYAQMADRMQPVIDAMMKAPATTKPGDSAR